jgi:omega-6 fatty acid desaturase (delta-12 desaturase)
MSAESGAARSAISSPSWYKALSEYERSSLRKAVWQLVNTLAPYAALWGLMAFFVHKGYPYWTTLALAVLAAPLMVRIFIFFHDCCHNSFFASPRANRVLGYITGVLTFTPLEDWRRAHAIHHATAGDLDRRGVGDVKTLTVQEYLAASRLKRIAYRFYRNPLVMLGVAPALLSIVVQRFPHRGAGRRERASVLITNLAILGILGAASLTIGLGTYLMVQLPISFLAMSMGVWLFYVQHQYEGVYWARHTQWDPLKAAMEGSSYYRLPRLLQWCTGSIGLHHIHHARPGIPNYNLQPCHENTPAAQTVEPLGVWGSLKSLRLHLWDERDQRLVGFRAIRKHLGAGEARG